jgi:SAM-dependent methyltransferase
MTANKMSVGKKVQDAAFRGVRYVWSRMNDRYLNIDTSDEAYYHDVDRQKGFPFATVRQETKHKDSIIYQGGNYRNIRRIIDVVKPGADDVFFDIGCGKGRCLCMFARQPLRRVVGIELNASLAEAARVNAERLRGRRAPIEVRCADAATADYSDGTIYLLYCPFGPETMRDVLDSIERSVKSIPRQIKIVYYDAMFQEVFRSRPWLQEVNHWTTFTGRPIALFVNRPT